MTNDIKFNASKQLQAKNKIAKMMSERIEEGAENLIPEMARLLTFWGIDMPRAAELSISAYRQAKSI